MSRESPRSDLVCRGYQVRRLQEGSRGLCSGQRIGHTAIGGEVDTGGARVVYLSTASVFDGLRPHRSADDPPCPRTEYGRQNAAAEVSLQGLEGLVTILRLTKTLGPNLPLFRGWVRSLKRGQPIHPYADLVMAPIPLTFVVQVIHRLAQAPVSGIYQASANRDITYEDAARCCAATLGFNPALVQPIKVRQEELYIEDIPSHTTLDMGRLKAEFDIHMPDVRQTLRDYFRDLGNELRESS